MKLKRSATFIVLTLFSLYSFSQILNIEDPTLTLDSISNHDFKCGISVAGNIVQQKNFVYDASLLGEMVYHHNDRHQLLMNGQYLLIGTEVIKDTRQLAPQNFRMATYEDWQNLFSYWGGINKSFRILHDNKDKKFNSDCMLGHRSGWIHVSESSWWTSERYRFILAVDDPVEEEINSLDELGESWGIDFEKNPNENWSDGYLVRCIRE